MKLMAMVIMALLTAGFYLSATAVELEPVPKKFPAEHRAAFTRERAQLLAQKKSLNGKLSRHNRLCATPKPYQAHQCSTTRLELFQAVDKYNNQVEDFNKRLTAATVGNASVEKKLSDTVKP